MKAISEGGDITGGNIAGDHCIEVNEPLVDDIVPEHSFVMLNMTEAFFDVSMTDRFIDMS